jgi:hypothetical protein
LSTTTIFTTLFAGTIGCTPVEDTETKARTGLPSAAVTTNTTTTIIATLFSVTGVRACVALELGITLKPNTAGSA